MCVLCPGTDDDQLIGALELIVDLESVLSRNMKKHPFHRIGLMAVMLFIGSLVAGWAIDLGSQIAKKIRYPVYDAKGQLQYEVLGDEARVGEVVVDQHIGALDRVEA